jgi:hypothetical protein
MGGMGEMGGGPGMGVWELHVAAKKPCVSMVPWPVDIAVPTTLLGVSPPSLKQLCHPSHAVRRGSRHMAVTRSITTATERNWH